MDTNSPKGENVAASAIFKKFLGKAEEYISKPTRIKQLLTDAYQKASDKKDVGSIAHEAWETMQTLFRLIRSSVSGEYTGLPTPTIIAAIAVVIYFLSPIDLIPDFIPVLGLLDDVALVAWFSSTLKDEMDRFAEWEKTRVSVVGADHDTSVPSTGTSQSSSAKNTSPGGVNPTAAATATETTESGKLHGTTDLSPSDKQPSDTDSGISSPDSSNPNPSLTGSTDPAPANPQPHTTDPNSPNILAGSRVPNTGPADNGGNIR